MNIIRLSGGLGNQMFQYAFGRKISIQRNEKLMLDISAYNNYQLFKYGLDCYNIDCDKTNNRLLYNNKYFRKIFRIAASFGFNKLFKYFVEQKLFRFDKNVLNSKSNYFIGSWQSFKYFEDIKDIIANDFSLKATISLECSNMIHQMNASESISIHIRRGDYFSDKRTKKYHGILNLEYFDNALQFVTEKIDSPVIFIFSDDIKWVKENFYTEYPFQFIDKSFGGPEISIHMMTKCKHNIISNSSFSWWGAWLNQNPDKMVMAPKIWMRNNHSSPDLIPKEWNLL